mgnify:CR=1 FL=1
MCIFPGIDIGIADDIIFGCSIPFIIKTFEFIDIRNQVLMVEIDGRKGKGERVLVVGQRKRQRFR